MEFRIENCAILIKKIRKRQIMKGRELANQERIKTLGENETYKYLGIFEVKII